MIGHFQVAADGPGALADAHPAPRDCCYRLGSLRLSDLVRLGQAMRDTARGAGSMEEVADRMVRHLFDACIDPQTGEREIVLVRMFKTHPFGDLDPELQHAARTIAGPVEPAAATKCLVLLATAGVLPAWNSRHDSGGHKAIPLLSDDFVARIPMISQLIRQFGLPIAHVVQAAPGLMVELDERSYNVFHIEEALGCSYIPAQAQFVVPNGV